MFAICFIPVGVFLPIYLYKTVLKKTLYVEYNDDKLPVVLFRHKYEHTSRDLKNRLDLFSTEEHPIQIIDNHTNKVILFEIGGLIKEDWNNFIDDFRQEKIVLEYRKNL
jgi:hypothetical protein